MPAGPRSRNFWGPEVLPVCMNLFIRYAQANVIEQVVHNWYWIEDLNHLDFDTTRGLLVFQRHWDLHWFLSMLAHCNYCIDICRAHAHSSTCHNNCHAQTMKAIPSIYGDFAKSPEISTYILAGVRCHFSSPRMNGRLTRFLRLTTQAWFSKVDLLMVASYLSSTWKSQGTFKWFRALFTAFLMLETSYYQWPGSWDTDCNLEHKMKLKNSMPQYYVMIEGIIFTTPYCMFDSQTIIKRYPWNAHAYIASLDPHYLKIDQVSR